MEFHGSHRVISFNILFWWGNRTPPFVRLTEKAEKIAGQEAEAVELMDPNLVKYLRKLLMLSVDCRVPLEKIKFVESELGLPNGYKKSLIARCSEFFSVKDVNGKACVCLEIWDSSLAVTAGEEKLASEGILASAGNPRKVRISEDSNYPGPHTFEINFPSGFRPNMSDLEELEKWQKMEFPSLCLNAGRLEIADPKARKRVVGVLHKLLSSTMEKRMTAAQLDACQSECFLPSKLLLCLIKHHGIFYITNEGARSTVFLKEGYDGPKLVEKCPMSLFNDKFVALSGRGEISSSKEMPSTKHVY